MKSMGFRSDPHPLAVRPGHVTQGLCVAVPESGEGRWADGMGRPRGGRRWPPALSTRPFFVPARPSHGTPLPRSHRDLPTAVGGHPVP